MDTLRRKPLQNDTARKPQRVSAALLKDMRERLQSAGLEDAPIDAAMRQSQQAFGDTDARFPAELRQRQWQLGGEHLPRPTLGLDLARGVRPQHLGVAGHIALNCATLGEAYQALGRFQSLISEDDQFTYRVEGQLCVLTYDLEASPDCHRLIVDNVMACQCALMRHLTATQVCPQRVHFRFPAPVDVLPYREFFGCPVFFDQTENALFFHHSVYQLPIPTANTYTRDVLIQHAERLLQAPTPPLCWKDRVKVEIKRGLHMRQTGADDLARRLHVSRRTLQRRLAQEGCLLSELLQEVQHAMALDYLHMQNLPLIEIAQLVGFAEPSSFHRAFKRWFGCSPLEYRFGRVDPAKQAAAGAG